MKDYVTYLYTNPPNKGTFKQAPEIDGRLCVGIAFENRFEEADRAMGFIARLADGEFSDPEEAALDFFRGTGWESTYPCLKDDYKKPAQ